jgi:hypothetical protein
MNRITLSESDMPATANHRHVCACGTVLACTQEPDRCAVSPSTAWACPACLMQQLDDFLRAHAPGADGHP